MRVFNHILKLYTDRTKCQLLIADKRGTKTIHVHILYRIKLSRVFDPVYGKQQRLSIKETFFDHNFENITKIKFLIELYQVSKYEYVLARLCVHDVKIRKVERRKGRRKRTARIEDHPRIAWKFLDKVYDVSGSSFSNVF